MISQQLDEEAIFQVAKDIPVLESRSSYLDQVCAGDQALRERVEALLAVQGEMAATLIDFTSVSTFSVSEMSSPVTKTPGKGPHHSPG